MTKKSNEPKILLDCDVIIHFIKGGQQLLLTKIYPKRLVLLDKVLSELEKRRNSRVIIENFIKYTKIEVIPFPKKIEIIKEYSKLKKIMGDGEAACLAVARYTENYIASSNLIDIKKYCQAHNIVYLTTMDILLEAYRLKIMDEVECNNFITEVKAKKSKLVNGIDTISDYEAYIKKQPKQTE
ncbi:MAG TPA: hypothetical protein VF985_02185 [Mariniflexile sp.]